MAHVDGSECEAHFRPNRRHVHGCDAHHVCDGVDVAVPHDDEGEHDAHLNVAKHPSSLSLLRSKT